MIAAGNAVALPAAFRAADRLPSLTVGTSCSRWPGRAAGTARAYHAVRHGGPATLTPGQPARIERRSCHLGRRSGDERPRRLLGSRSWRRSSSLLRLGAGGPGFVQGQGGDFGLELLSMSRAGRGGRVQRGVGRSALVCGEPIDSGRLMVRSPHRTRVLCSRVSWPAQVMHCGRSSAGSRHGATRTTRPQDRFGCYATTPTAAPSTTQAAARRCDETISPEETLVEPGPGFGDGGGRTDAISATLQSPHRLLQPVHTGRASAHPISPPPSNEGAS